VGLRLLDSIHLLSPPSLAWRSSAQRMSPGPPLPEPWHRLLCAAMSRRGLRWRRLNTTRPCSVRTHTHRPLPPPPFHQPHPPSVRSAHGGKTHHLRSSPFSSINNLWYRRGREPHDLRCIVGTGPASETPKMYAFDGWTMDTYTTSKMVCRSYKQIV